MKYPNECLLNYLGLHTVFSLHNFMALRRQLFGDRYVSLGNMKNRILLFNIIVALQSLDGAVELF